MHQRKYKDHIEKYLKLKDFEKIQFGFEININMTIIQNIKQIIKNLQ